MSEDRTIPGPNIQTLAQTDFLKAGSHTWYIPPAIKGTNQLFLFRIHPQYCCISLNIRIRMKTVSRWLGHSLPKTTMETNARVLKTTIKNEALEVKRSYYK